MGVSPAVVTSLASLGAVVVIVAAAVALGWRCMGVLGQTVVGADRRIELSNLLSSSGGSN